MHRIVLVQSTPTDPEIAVLKLDGNDHAEFHKNPVQFVNKNHVFKSDVSSVDIPLAEHKKPLTGVLVIVHLPPCNCVAYCGVG